MDDELFFFWFCFCPIDASDRQSKCNPISIFPSSLEWNPKFDFRNLWASASVRNREGLQHLYFFLILNARTLKKILDWSWTDNESVNQSFRPHKFIQDYTYTKCWWLSTTRWYRAKFSSLTWAIPKKRITFRVPLNLLSQSFWTRT